MAFLLLCQGRSKLPVAHAQVTAYILERYTIIEWTSPTPFDIGISSIWQWVTRTMTVLITLKVWSGPPWKWCESPSNLG
jgi:hypothetical protein